MTLQTLARPIVWPGMALNATAAPAIGADVAMTAAGHYVCQVVRAHRAMTITHMGFYPQAATGSPTADYRVETVDATTGLPTGTLWAANTNIVTGTLTAGTWNLSALTASASIAEGDVVAFKWAMNSGTTLSSGRIASYGVGDVSPYNVNNTGTPAKAVASRALVAIGESSTSFVAFQDMIPANAATQNTFNNTSAAKRGARFQVPFKCRAIGLRWFNNTQAGDCNALIMDDSGTDLGSTSIAVDKDQTFANAGGCHSVMFLNPAVLSPGTWYRIAVEPTSATNENISTFTLPTADYRTGFPGGTNYHYATFVTATWTDVTDQVPLMDLLIDQLDDAVSTGGGGMGGNFGRGFGS